VTTEPLVLWTDGKQNKAVKAASQGLGKNVSGAYRKEKKQLLDKLDSLHKKAEY
jgi:hypothetical protein